MYSPSIDPDLIPRIYRIGQVKKQPMTRVVHEFLSKAIKREEKKLKGKLVEVFGKEAI